MPSGEPIALLRVLVASAFTKRQWLGILHLVALLKGILESKQPRRHDFAIGDL